MFPLVLLVPHFWFLEFDIIHDLNSISSLLRSKKGGLFVFLSVQYAELISAAVSIKLHPNRLFSLSLCGSLIILKSKFASRKRKSGRN